ncbi:hypothetical protein GCM10007424_12070 [Flavobacterium suaedae]|uniref:Uncharacterized protein n=1 Tax=Flavobacterium suaedae TaxID=1767027 RepID=A0ABQ1JTE0_9FLAO|nr:hypothetical protein [Flavobacterium suaedae]GGB73773.1 hypothetical protein GCM10007424_12070 [Flavobacterium suaedae]
MKVIKYLFLLIFVLAAGFATYIFTLPSEFSVTESKLIYSPKDITYEYAKSYFNISNTSNDTIQLDNTNWTFKDSVNQTNITAHFNGKLSFTDKVYTFLNNDKKEEKRKELQEQLTSLNTSLSESLNKYTIDYEKTYFKENIYLVYDSINKTVSENKYMLIKDIQAAKSTKPVLLKKYNSKKTYVYLPFNKNIEGEFKTDTIAVFPALKTTLTGHYSHMQEAQKATRNYCKEKRIVIDSTGYYIENYKRTPQQTAIPSEWVTELYYPIIEIEIETDSIVDTDTLN